MSSEPSSTPEDTQPSASPHAPNTTTTHASVAVLIDAADHDDRGDLQHNDVDGDQESSIVSWLQGVFKFFSGALPLTFFLAAAITHFDPKKQLTGLQKFWEVAQVIITGSLNGRIYFTDILAILEEFLKFKDKPAQAGRAFEKGKFTRIKEFFEAEGLSLTAVGMVLLHLIRLYLATSFALSSAMFLIGDMQAPKNKENLDSMLFSGASTGLSFIGLIMEFSIAFRAVLSIIDFPLKKLGLVPLEKDETGNFFGKEGPCSLPGAVRMTSMAASVFLSSVFLPAGLGSMQRGAAWDSPMIQMLTPFFTMPMLRGSPNMALGASLGFFALLCVFLTKSIEAVFNSVLNSVNWRPVHFLVLAASVGLAYLSTASAEAIVAEGTSKALTEGGLVAMLATFGEMLKASRWNGKVVPTLFNQNGPMAPYGRYRQPYIDDPNKGKTDPGCKDMFFRATVRRSSAGNDGQAQRQDVQQPLVTADAQNAETASSGGEYGGVAVRSM